MVISDLNAVISIKNKIENIMSASFPVILALFFAAIIGLLYWEFFTSKVFSDLIYLLTLLILILYTYYTLQVVKFAYKGPALLHVQIQHSDTLKVFLNNWSKLISDLPFIENRIGENRSYYFDRYIERYRNYQNNWEYRDLLDYHLPESYNDLKNNFDDLIRTITHLKSKVDKLYSSIDEEIDVELNDIKQKYPSISLGKSEDIRYLKDEIYLKCIKNNSRKDIGLEVESCGVDSCQLRAVNVVSNVKVLLVGNKEHVALAKEMLGKIVFNDYTNKKHADLIVEIKRCRSEMIRKRNELKREIDELANWTLLPGTSCDRLKDFSISR